jgi:hypothetical protein
MNERFARRYHWHSENVECLIRDPHAAICSDLLLKRTLNLVATESTAAQAMITDLAREQPAKLITELQTLQTLSLPSHHQVNVKDLRPESIEKVLLKTYEAKAGDFQTLLGLPGVGAKTLRALALIAENYLWNAGVVEGSGQVQLRSRRQRRASLSRESAGLRSIDRFSASHA